MTRHVEITQNNKLAISLQQLKKEVSNLLHAISMKIPYGLIQWFLMGVVKNSQNCPKSKFEMSLQYLKKEVRDEVYFLHSDKHQSFQQVDFNTLGIKFSYKVILGMIKHLQSTRSNKFTISVQNLKK